MGFLKGGIVFGVRGSEPLIHNASLSVSPVRMRSTLVSW